VRAERASARACALCANAAAAAAGLYWRTAKTCCLAPPCLAHYYAAKYAGLVAYGEAARLACARPGTFAAFFDGRSRTADRARKLERAAARARGGRVLLLHAHAALLVVATYWWPYRLRADPGFGLTPADYAKVVLGETVAAEALQVALWFAWGAPYFLLHHPAHARARAAAPGAAARPGRGADGRARAAAAFAVLAALAVLLVYGAAAAGGAAASRVDRYGDVVPACRRLDRSRDD
jgi:hypothetical protein